MLRVLHLQDKRNVCLNLHRASLQNITDTDRAIIRSVSSSAIRKEFIKGEEPG
jgi:hypothetical protein